MAHESEIKDPEHPLPSIQNGRLEYAIDHFAFEDEDTLHEIHFTLEKGQTLGLVGQTGSGKTSLLKLLLREYDVNQGAIYLNGHDIREYRLAMFLKTSFFLQLLSSKMFVLEIQV